MSSSVRQFALGLGLGGVVVAGGVVYKLNSPEPAPEPQKAQAVPAATAKEQPEPKEEETVEGIPWLKKVPGVKYSKPKKTPEILYKKYQSFEDSFKAAKEGGGQFSKDGYQVNWVDPNSDLSQRIGLRAGDKVISVNGQPVGQSVGSGKAMFDQLKNESSFSVLIERDGKTEVLTYTVEKKAEAEPGK